jgi:hypothetical protein
MKKIFILFVASILAHYFIIKHNILPSEQPTQLHSNQPTQIPLNQLTQLHIQNWKEKL